MALAWRAPKRAAASGCRRERLPGHSGHHSRIVIEDETLGNPAQTNQAAQKRGQKVSEGLGMREEAGMSGRVGQRDDEAEGSPSSVPSHRDLDRKVPPVELSDLAGEVGGALVGLRGQELGPHLAEEVLEDGLAAGIALGLQPFPDDRRRGASILDKERAHAVFEGIKKGGCRRTLIAGRLRQT